MTLFSNDKGPVFAFRHHGLTAYAEQGDQVSVEFPDGKGVSGVLAGVDIAPGGTPFSLLVTHDGQWPEQNYTVEVGGQMFTAEQWEAAERCIRGTSAQTADAAPETPVDEAQDTPGGVDRSDAERVLRRLLRAEIVRTHEAERELAEATARANEAEDEIHRLRERLSWPPGKVISTGTIEGEVTFHHTPEVRTVVINVNVPEGVSLTVNQAG